MDNPIPCLGCVHCLSNNGRDLQADNPRETSKEARHRATKAGYTTRACRHQVAFASNPVQANSHALL